MRTSLKVEPVRHFEAENYLGLLDAKVVMAPGRGRLAGRPFDFKVEDQEADDAARRLCEHFAAAWAVNQEEGRDLIVLDQPLIVFKDAEFPKSPWLYRLRGSWAHPEDVPAEFPRLRLLDVLSTNATKAYDKLGAHP